MAGSINFSAKLLGLGLNLFGIFFLLFGFDAEIRRRLGALFGKEAGDLSVCIINVRANVFGLIVIPLIGGPRLEQNLLGVRAMAQQIRDGEQHRENGHREANGALA